MQITKSSVFALMLMLSLTACASSPSGYAAAEVTRQESSDSIAGRLVSYVASIDLVVEDLDTFNAQVNSLVSQHKGFILRSRIDDGLSYSAVIKIPAADLNDSLDQIGNLGKEKNRAIESADVTDAVIDAEAQLKNLIALRGRLRELLTRAKTVDEVLKIESELARVQTEIDALNARLKTLQGQINYSEVNIYARKKRVYGPITYIFVGAGWALQKLFVIE